MKIAELTPDRFMDWLKRNPDRVLICEDENECAIAQFVADELLEGDERYVAVDGMNIGVQLEDQDVFDWEEYNAPDWVPQFVTVFDQYWHLDEDGLDGLSEYVDGGAVARTGEQTLALIEREGFTWARG